MYVYSDVGLLGALRLCDELKAYHIDIRTSRI